MKWTSNPYTQQEFVHIPKYKLKKYNNQNKMPESFVTAKSGFWRAFHLNAPGAKACPFLLWLRNQ